MLNRKQKHRVTHHIELPIVAEINIFGFVFKFVLLNTNDSYYKITGYDVKFYSLLEAQNFALENDIDLEVL
jgi:hypothetical protein